jgi:regulator of nucleoside diphosphate kinase
MKKRMVITINDYQRLLGLMELTSLRMKMPRIITQLYEDIMKAKLLPQENISNNVITMNSRVLLKDVSSEREAELTITYPQDADNLERKVSVFSTIGIELLGKQSGGIVSWTTPNGVGYFEILKVTYQPEAVGHYSL